MFEEEFLVRYWAKIDKKGEDDCWIWTAATAGKGYGYIKLKQSSKHVYAHRASYMIHKGAIPEGALVLHSCDNPRCCNPKHLSIGSYGDNSQDMKSKGRHLYGERNAEAKMTESQILAIRILLRDTSQHKIAKMFGISQGQVSRIKRGVRWAHLKDKE